MILIEQWKEQVIRARSRGLTDVQCAASARVTLAQLKQALTVDENFKTRYDNAVANPIRTQW
jgi:hypothetical protein